MYNRAFLFNGIGSKPEKLLVKLPSELMDKYEVYLLGITKEGRWVLVDSVEDIRSGAWRESGRI